MPTVAGKGRGLSVSVWRVCVVLFVCVRVCVVLFAGVRLE